MYKTKLQFCHISINAVLDVKILFLETEESDRKFEIVRHLVIGNVKNPHKETIMFQQNN